MTTIGWIILAAFGALFAFTIWWILTRKNDGTDKGFMGDQNSWW